MQALRNQNYWDFHGNDYLLQVVGEKEEVRKDVRRCFGAAYKEAPHFLDCDEETEDGI